jgi:glycine oxidase
MKGFDTAIVGGGVIGLAIGWRLASTGKRVAIIDRGEAGRAASWASGGMLGNDAEIGFEELEVYSLGAASTKLWPDFVRDLEEASGLDVGYRTEGTLMVADDADGAANLRRIFRFQQEQKVPVEWIAVSRALELEPLLTPRLTAAVLSESDRQVDPRLMVTALKKAFLAAGGFLIEHQRVVRVESAGSVMHCLMEAADAVESEHVVLAAGAWSSLVDVSEVQPPPVRPVKGQMLELRMLPQLEITHVIRGRATYLAPKQNGRLLVGSTSEEMGYDETVTAGGVYELLEKAWRLIPAIYDMPLTDSWAGLRPASPDHAPLIGFAEDPRIMFATGHHRHGILLAPVTAVAVADLLTKGNTSMPIAVCSPDRFGIDVGAPQ